MLTSNLLLLNMTVEDIQKGSARCFAMQHVEKNTKEISDVTLASEYDKENSNAVECVLEMAGLEFFNVTNEDVMKIIAVNTEIRGSLYGKTIDIYKAVDDKLVDEKIFNEVTKLNGLKPLTLVK